jgi:hypothetical protein
MALKTANICSTPTNVGWFKYDKLDIPLTPVAKNTIGICGLSHLSSQKVSYGRTQHKPRSQVKLKFRHFIPVTNEKGSLFPHVNSLYRSSFL